MFLDATKHNENVTDLANAKVGESVTVSGMIHNVRVTKWGGFIVLRKSRGLLQAVVSNDQSTFFNENGEAIAMNDLCREMAITITGTVNVVLDWTQSDCSEKQIDYIYGASNDASYTPTAAAATGENFSPVVTLLHGTVNENVYGGGKGPTATVTAKPKVIAGDPSKSNNKKVSVMGDIFGGGNAAPVVGSTNVIVGHNSNVGRNVFGGGNAAPVSVDTEVEIKDKARISGNIYGGGNQGEIGRNTKVIVNGN